MISKDRLDLMIHEACRACPQSSKDLHMLLYIIIQEVSTWLTLDVDGLRSLEAMWLCVDSFAHRADLWPVA